jgi:hypothetical protein
LQAHSKTDSQSVEIKKSTASTINWTGPSQDGVNHDQDVIYLDLSAGGASWLLSDAPSPIQYVYVGWLKLSPAPPPLPRIPPDPSNEIEFAVLKVWLAEVVVPVVLPAA